MNSFILKIIGIICMTCDHASDAFIGHLNILNLIGRIAFPLFAFQAVIGYRKTKNVEKYLIRLLIFAMISQIPYLIFLNTIQIEATNINVIFSILFGVLSLYIFDYDFKNKKINKTCMVFLKFLIIIMIAILSELLHMEYGAYMIALMMTIHLFYRNEKIKFKYQSILFIISYILISILLYVDYFNKFAIQDIIRLILFTNIPLLLICFYNDKKGIGVKYLFYIYYPLHLLILSLIKYLI